MAQIDTTLSPRHTPCYGFGAYDAIHVASALLSGCDTFWSLDTKASRLAKAGEAQDHPSMTTTTVDKIDKSAESFRDKILRKCGESVEMKQKFFEKYADEIEELSREMAKRFTDGKKLLTMGNGGSLADAIHFTVEFTHPIIEKRAAFPVISLVNDTATMTAVGNDIDFSRVFVNQLRLLGQPGDMALAVSTSGKSPNLIYALEEARKRDMLTIAWGGKDGGRFPEVADYCFIVPSYSIHRIQEVHATLVHVLWDLIHIALGAEDVI